MDIVLNLLENWGIYLITGVLLIYFGWHGMAFMQAHPVSFKHDPILTTTTLGWGSLWLVGNGAGNTLFIFTIATMVYDLVVYHTGAFNVPALPGIEALVFLIGLMPSLYQFRYQSDPDYIASLSASRRLVAIGMTLVDGIATKLGWYWWLLPPTFSNGHFDFIYDQSLVLGCLAWGVVTSYIAQFMAHMQLYDLLGLTAPTFPNPFAGLWASLPWVSSKAEEVSATPRPARSQRATRRQPTHSHQPTPSAPALRDEMNVPS